jgi:hypothetical protein
VNTELRSLELTGGHLARLVVAFQFEAELLAFEEIAHTGAFDGRDVDENIGAAVVRLDKAEALGGIEPFYSACGHDEPFQSMMLYERARCASDKVISILKGKFVRGTLQGRKKKILASNIDDRAFKRFRIFCQIIIGEVRRFYFEKMS